MHFQVATAPFLVYADFGGSIRKKMAPQSQCEERCEWGLRFSNSTLQGGATKHKVPGGLCVCITYLGISVVLKFCPPSCEGLCSTNFI